MTRQPTDAPSLAQAEDPPLDPPGERRKELAALLLTAAAVAAALLAIARRPEQPAWGYGAIFVMSVITGVLPGPTTVLVAMAATRLSPLVLALTAGLGSAIGESSSYAAGYGSRFFSVPDGGGPRWLVNSRFYRWVDGHVVHWMGRHPFLTLFVIGAIPNFAIDLAGIVAGRLRYPYPRYLLANVLGKSVRFGSVALAARWLWPPS